MNARREAKPQAAVGRGARSRPSPTGHGLARAGRLRERPLVIAHRGASGHRPENTLPAYELAIAMGADMIEIDLHRTRDGEIVITHDELLASLGGTGEIADTPLDQVRRLDAGNGERVPRLAEVLDRFGAAIPFNLELKQSTRGAYPDLEASTLVEVERRGLLGETLFSSFYDGVLRTLRDASPRARIGFLVSPRFPHRALERARDVGAEALHPEVSLVTPELVRDAHAEELAVHVFTVDDPEAMRHLLDLGVDGLFTNYPDRMRLLLDAGD